MARGRKTGAPNPKPSVGGAIFGVNAKAVGGWKERVRAEMEAQGLSRRALAGKAGLGAASMNYLLNEAATLSLETASQIASALGLSVKEIVTGERVIIETDDDIGRLHLRLVKVADSDIKVRDAHGVVALPMAGLGAMRDVRAFRQSDLSMIERGQNEPVPDTMIVSHGDIVIWSPEAKPQPGTLVVLHEKVGRDQFLAVRRLVRSGDDFQAAANNADYGRRDIKLADVLGSVVGIQRRI